MKGIRIIGHIFLREYLERVRSKAFIILTLLAPLILVAIVGVPILLATRSSKGQKIAIVDMGGRLAPLVEQRLTERSSRPADLARDLDNSPTRRNMFIADQYHVEIVKVEPGHEAEVRARLSREVQQNRLDAYVWIEPAALEKGQVDYYARNLTDIAGLEAMQRAVSSSVVHVRLVERGLPSEQIQALLKSVRLRTVRVSERGEKEDKGLGAFLLSFFFTMLLYTTLILYGVAVMRSVIEEKTSRIFEVLLSSVRPIDLMAGKILGVAAVGLTQYLVWALMLALVSGSGIAAMGPQLGDLSVTPLMLIFFVVFFLLGYLLYSAMFAALGAAVNNEQEAQQLQILIVQFLILPVLLQQMVLRNPSSPWSVGLSLFPFFTPMLMFLRITVQTPPAWQIALSVVMLAATIVVVMWACARIYRIGILMYGKRPTLPELWRWMRTG